MCSFSFFFEQSSHCQRIAGSTPSWACQSVPEQDTQPKIAPDEPFGALHGSQSTLVCEWVNEKQKLYSTLDIGMNHTVIWIKALYKCRKCTHGQTLTQTYVHLSPILNQSSPKYRGLFRWLGQTMSIKGSCSFFKKPITDCWVRARGRGDITSVVGLTPCSKPCLLPEEHWSIAIYGYHFGASDSIRAQYITLVSLTYCFSCFCVSYVYVYASACVCVYLVYLCG